MTNIFQTATYHFGGLRGLSEEINATLALMEALMIVAEGDNEEQTARAMRWIEGRADELEILVTAREMEIALRAEVAERLTPTGYVEIPGLGRSIPVYA